MAWAKPLKTTWVCLTNKINAAANARIEFMNQDHITMIMPTYNHPTYIEYFLANSLATYKGKLFKFEIHDSSTDSQTEDLVRKFNEDHGDIKIRRAHV